MDFPELFLKRIWQQRLYSSTGLATTDGKPVLILSPGTPNTDVGPDFTDARIRIGNITFQGDVELHRTARDWRLHGHQNDPHYNRVILHVVLSDEHLGPPALTAARRPLPLLVLHPFLDPATRPAVMASLSDEAGGATPPLACRRSADMVPAAILRKWLEHVAEERIEMKIRRHETRLRELIDERKRRIAEPYPRYYGNPDEIPQPEQSHTARDAAASILWDQLLYEGIMEALGYAKNEAAFSALARSVPLATLRRTGLQQTCDVTALLFGAAGLLPPARTVADLESRRLLRLLRRRWRELRSLITGPLLHEGDWKFFRLRPGNFPTVRLATIARLMPKLFGDEAFRELVALFKSGTLTPAERYRMLAGRFRDTPDMFWLHHYRFGPATRVQTGGLGAQRVADMVVNVIIPVMLLYARIFHDSTVRSHVRALLGWMPGLQQNTVTRRVAKELVKGRIALRSMLLHQGILQLYRMYCRQGRCRECSIAAALPVQAVFPS
jgi:hypothetical protein